MSFLVIPEFDLVIFADDVVPVPTGDFVMAGVVGDVLQTFRDMLKTCP